MGAIKCGAISGSVMIALVAILFILSMVSFFTLEGNPLLAQSSSMGVLSILNFILSLVISLCSVFVFYAFIQVGKKAGSALLTLSSWVFFVLSILGIIFLVIVGILSLAVPVQAAELGDLPADFDASNLVGNTGAAINPALAGVLGIIILIIFLAALVFAILFAVGLIQVGKSVRYARMVGVFNLAAIALGIVLAIFVMSLILNPLLLLQMLFSGSLFTWILVIQIIFFVLSITIISLETAALFDAAKKFEE